MTLNNNSRIYPKYLFEKFYKEMLNKRRKEQRKEKLEKIKDVQFKDDRMG